MKLLLISGPRYSINACDFSMFFRNSDHEVIKVLHHKMIAQKDWFFSGEYSGSSRNGICCKLTDHKRESYSGNSELLKKIYKTDFDYLCVGNGNDDTGKILTKEYKGNILYSEYGFLPWQENFYIDDQGVGPLSSITKMDIDKIKVTESDKKEISRIKQKLDIGSEFMWRDYVYVPLQVDTPTSDGNPDFKFQFTQFKNNIEFLNHVRKIVPKDVPILVKNHPASRKPTHIPSDMIDISHKSYNKRFIYQNMLGMICMNSTSVLEALLFDKPVFTFGKDIFSNKGLTIEGATKDDLEKILGRTRWLPSENDKFISVLLQRQVNRSLCKDKEYVKKHYWNQELLNRTSE